MQFFQHLNQPIPPPNTHWTSSTVQIKKGTRPFPGLIEPVRDRTYTNDACMRAGGPLIGFCSYVYSLPFFPSIA